MALFHKELMHLDTDSDSFWHVETCFPDEKKQTEAAAVMAAETIDGHARYGLYGVEERAAAAADDERRRRLETQTMNSMDSMPSQLQLRAKNIRPLGWPPGEEEDERASGLERIDGESSTVSFGAARTPNGGRNGGSNSGATTTTTTSRAPPVPLHLGSFRPMVPPPSDVPDLLHRRRQTSAGLEWRLQPLDDSISAALEYVPELVSSQLGDTPASDSPASTCSPMGWAHWESEVARKRRCEDSDGGVAKRRRELPLGVQLGVQMGEQMGEQMTVPLGEQCRASVTAEAAKHGGPVAASERVEPVESMSAKPVTVKTVQDTNEPAAERSRPEGSERTDCGEPEPNANTVATASATTATTTTNTTGGANSAATGSNASDAPDGASNTNNASSAATTAPTGARKKRQRRKFHEVQRNFYCGYRGCTKAYSMLSHLNTHIKKTGHGQRCTLDEYYKTRAVYASYAMPSAPPTYAPYYSSLVQPPTPYLYASPYGHSSIAAFQASPQRAATLGMHPAAMGPASMASTCYLPGGNPAAAAGVPMTAALPVDAQQHRMSSSQAYPMQYAAAMQQAAAYRSVPNLMPTMLTSPYRPQDYRLCYTPAPVSPWLPYYAAAAAAAAPSAVQPSTPTPICVGNGTMMDELVAPSTPSAPQASNNSRVSMDLLSSYSQLQSQGKSDAAAAAAAHASSNGMTAVDPSSPLDMYGSSWDVSR